ncbi:WhiB family transcriptional regulator [Brevibacterium litoralis]|uniref:WhiB family transcriptional regulator n=1 Tax=Brevibacterium litoralis TaxID=3138935 RepID=UPI0032EBA911
MAEAARKYAEERQDLLRPGVTSRAAEDWFVDPTRPVPDFVPDPLSLDPTDLGPVPTWNPETPAADDQAVSPLSLLLGGTPDGLLAWQDQALCAQTDPEAFFPEKGGSTREAKKVCASCEVRSECLDYALDNDERFGIWGGLSERERRKIKQLKKRAG